MSKGKKIITSIVIVMVLIIALGLIHIPTWLTYPYDVTIYNGYIRINEYLSEEKEICIPKRILGIEVKMIDEEAFNDFGTDIIIKSVPEGIVNAQHLYHKESQSYYDLCGDEACLGRYVGDGKKIEIPEEVWGRKVTAFSIMTGSFTYLDVEEVIIPETVTRIGSYAFEGCKYLKQIKLPNQLVTIEEGCFYESGIESIVIPESVRTIGTSAFSYSKLKEITGLENVECIGSDPFRGTLWEESIEGDFVCFKDALLLYRGNDEEVVVPSTVKEIKGAFEREEKYPYPIKIAKVFVPDSVTVISAYSFGGQEGIKVYIPETVESIGDNLTYIGSIFGSDDKDTGIIITTAGSPAEAYAIEQEIPYEIISKEEMQQEMEAAKKRQENK